MFENKAFYVEMIDSRNPSAPTDSANPVTLQDSLTQVAKVVVGVMAAGFAMKTLSHILINISK